MVVIKPPDVMASDRPMTLANLRLGLAILACLFPALAGCAAATGARQPLDRAAGTEVQILAINDFHGNLEPPGIAIPARGPDGSQVEVPAGGAVYLASAASMLRKNAPHSVTVSAGDLIGASPLISALFLDEPTVRTAELIGVEYNAVGNHEFDRGTGELLRMQNGGCETFTTRQPCRLETYEGAGFQFLAANVRTERGDTLFPGTAVKDFGPVQDRLHRHDAEGDRDNRQPRRGQGADLP
jgi:5'-nucleotidase